MRRGTQFLSASVLILAAGLMLAGCNNGSGEVKYVNRANSGEVLTLNRSKTVKTKLIYTFHGTSTGTYTLKTNAGTTSGAFSSDENAIKFRPADGKPEVAKFKADGSFDFAQGSWGPAPTVIAKGLKAVAASTK